MKSKPVGLLALIVFALTILWLVQMVLVNMHLGEVTQFEQALDYAAEQHWFYFTFVYLNALLLTLANIVFYGSLFPLLKKIQPEISAAAFSIVPVYGILALCSYLSQIVLVPVLIEQVKDPQMTTFALGALQHVVQMWPKSTIGLFDQFSYFLLGIPGFLYGYLMIKDSNLRLPGLLFVLGSGFCFLIGIGIVLNYMPLVGIPSMIGGVLSIAAIGILAWKLLK